MTAGMGFNINPSRQTRQRTGNGLDTIELKLTWNPCSISYSIMQHGRLLHVMLLLEGCKYGEIAAPARPIGTTMGRDFIRELSSVFGDPEFFGI